MIFQNGIESTDEEEERRSQEEEPEVEGEGQVLEGFHHLLPTPCLVRDESYQFRCLALDYEMIAVGASARSDRNRLASVGIVDIDGVPVYEAY